MSFSKSSRPARPGTYVNFEAFAATQVPVSIGSIVAIPFTNDWGPFKTAVAIDSLAQYKALFGDSETTDGFRACSQAFRGEGVPGFGGAGRVIAYRFGGASAMKATKNLQNAGATPANALAVSAKYEGAKGNDLRLTVMANPAAGFKDLVVLDGSLELERFKHAQTDITALAAKINANSNWISATMTVTGTSLANVSGVALTGGDSGTTVIGTDYDAVWAALSTERFGIIAPYNVTSSPILASLVAWASALNDAGSVRFMVVVGGAVDEDIAAAVARSATIDNENFLNVGVGSVSDANLDDGGGNPLVLSTAMLAPRIAGILAARGEAMSMTFARLAGLTIAVGPSAADILQAFDGGVTVMSRDSNIEAPVRIEKGLTTFTDEHDTNKPLVIYRTPKYIRTMQGIQLEVEDFGNANVIGKLPVNNKTRDFVLAHVRSILAARERVSVIQPGWSADIDGNPPPSDDDEFIGLLIGLHFGRSVEQVFLTIRIG